MRNRSSAIISAISRNRKPHKKKHPYSEVTTSSDFGVIFPNLEYLLLHAYLSVQCSYLWLNGFKNRQIH